MKHTYSTTVTVEWHDLMEDPNDLPDNSQDKPTYVIMRNSNTGELGSFFFFDDYDRVDYNPKDKIWTADDYSEYDGYSVAGFRSYGLPCDNPEEKCDTLSDFEVIAWSYGPDISLPGYNPLTKGVWKNGEQTDGQA